MVDIMWRIFAGGEGFGLSAELRELCSAFLTVPSRRELHPAVDSLNVSVATGAQLHYAHASECKHIAKQI